MLQCPLQAKEKFEKEERRKELKRARGEGTWMLPEVDLKLQQVGHASSRPRADPDPH